MWNMEQSEKSCDNRDNDIQQEVIVVFCKKLKTPFRNHILSIHMMVWFGLSAFLKIRVDTRITFWNSCKKQDSQFRPKNLARFLRDLRVKISSETCKQILLWESREASLATKFCSKNCFLRASQKEITYQGSLLASLADKFRSKTRESGKQKFCSETCENHY